MISVVIPAFNEERALPETLAHLFSQPGEYEVIVVDGGSTDGTRRIVADYSDVQILQAPKGRASQMNAGAARARGEWLLFLHADTLLPKGALARIAQLPEGVAAGGFRHRFSGQGFGLWCISLLDNIRCTWSRIIFGDQAMFIRRSLFSRLGGFPDAERLEDVQFCELLVKHTKPILLEQTVTTDSRKFVQHGVWRSLMRVAITLACVSLGRRLPDDCLRFFEDVR